MSLVEDSYGEDVLLRRASEHVAEPRAGEVRVRVVGSGLSASGAVAHIEYEHAGIVDAVGAGVNKVRPGDAVVISFDYCGVCENCQRARIAYCAHVTRIAPEHGEVVPAPASHVIVNERAVVRVPANVPVELMGPLGRSVMAGAGAVINVLKPQPGSSLAVFGVGVVGMAALMAAKALGCATIIAVDRNSERLRMAESLGATHVINNEEYAIAEEIAGICSDGVQYALECTGSVEILHHAVRSLRSTGTCAMLGTASTGEEVRLPANFLLEGRSLRGVLRGNAIPDLFIPELISLWSQDRFPFDRLVQFYEPDELPRAVAAMRRGEVLKPIVRSTPW